MKKNYILAKRHLLFWVLFVIGLSAEAQIANKIAPGPGPIGIIDTVTYFGKMDVILGRLDKSRVSTGILYDRVFQLAHFEEFTGSSTADTSSSELFARANYELYTSAYNNTGLISSSTFDYRVSQAYTSGGYIPIGIISHAYNALDTLSIAYGGIQVVNKQLVETNNGYNIYLNKRVHTSAAITPNNYITPGNHTYQIDLSVSTLDKTINYVLVYADNGFVTYATPGISFAMSFAEGTHTLKTITYYTDGSTEYGYSFIICKAALASKITATADVEVHVVGLPFDSSQYPGVDLSFTRNRASEGTAAIFFADPANPVLRRPVVFLDGFDPTNSRDYRKIYDDFIDKSGLATQLKQLGYDLIILDYDEGGGLIERNGMLLIKTLDVLRTRYAPGGLVQDFVVIGPSMGSLVAQYALAKAEQLPAFPHHTRTFISFDGIHKGANIPIGLQLAYKRVLDLSLFGSFLKSVTSAFGTQIDVLNSPAAKQMLLHHYATGSESPLPHPFRNTFLSNLNALGNNGYPTLPRNVAITNGTNNAFSSTIANMTFYDFDLNTGLFNRRLVGMTLKTPPSTGRREVCDLKFRVSPLTIAAGLAGSYVGYAQGNGYSLDALPGSYTATLAESIPTKDSNNYPIYKMHARLFTDKLCFVPATGAVDLRLNSSNAFVPTYDWSHEDIVCTGKTPFNRVYTPSTSEAHVFVSNTSIDAFRREILGTPLPYALPAPVVSVQAPICPNSPATVTASFSNALPVTYTWTFDSNVAKVDGNSSSPYTTTNASVSVEVNDPSGTVLLVAATTSCGTSQDAMASVAVTTQSLGGVSVSEQQPLRTDSFSASINGYPGTSSYDWYINGQLVFPGAGTSIGFMAGNYFSCGFNHIDVVANTPCGPLSTDSSIGTDVELLCHKDTKALALYPNPAKNSVRIGEPGKVVAGTTVRLYNSRGQLARTITTSETDGVVDLNGLEPGLYFIKTTVGNESRTAQLKVE